MSGIRVGGYEHKIDLYADDIILICQSPVPSIKAILSIVHTFSQVSYYKLNHSKSTIMSITKSHLRKDSLTQFGFQWSESSLSYLGIKLTPLPYKTIDINISDLISTLTQEIKRLELFPLSWAARINITKMLLLPHFLYLSRTMPYLIPPASITTIHVCVHICRGS